MNSLRHTTNALLAAALLACASASHAGTEPAATEMRVVYHVNDVANAREALVNIANQLAADPHAKIALVANGRGIYMLVNGERDRVGDYSATITELEAKGVRFEACHNSMVTKNIEASTLVSGVVVVPAGVDELTRLQAIEHYAYIKP